MAGNSLILILGGNEFASAIAVGLVRSGLPVAMVVHPQEWALRRSICFSDTVWVGQKTIQDVQAFFINENLLTQFQEIDRIEQWKHAIEFYLKSHSLPVFLENDFPEFVETLKPQIIIKTHPEYLNDYPLDAAPLIIGLHPWHSIHHHCHLSVESRSNALLGELFQEPPTSVPAFDSHFFKNPFEEIYSPLEGVFISLKNIGEKIIHHDALGTIQEIQIRSPYDGQIWGLVHSGRFVKAKQPLALIYQGFSDDAYKLFDYRHKAVAGTILREILYFLNK